VLASSQIVSIPATEGADTPTPTTRKQVRAPSATDSELLLRTPKKPHDLYAAAQALEGSDITLRTILRKAGKALSKMSVDLATAKAISDGLQNQLDDLKTRG
jgi:hypothetical protein